MTERVKSALIFLLGLSALFLLSRTWVYDMEPEAAEGPALLAPARQDHSQTAVVPGRCAVTAGGVRTGSQYSEASREVYRAFIPFLAETLNSAGEARSLEVTEWRELLERDGVYFEYTGSYPLTLISAWLSVKNVPAGGDVTAIGFCFFEEETELFWRQTDGSVWSAAAGREIASWPDLPELQPCRFAFETGNPTWLLLIDDNALYENIRVDAPPGIEEDLDAYTPFMEALHMPPLSTNYFLRGDGRVYVDVEGDRSCEIRSDGTVFYTASAAVESAVTRGYADMPGAIYRAWELVSALTPAMGGATFELQKAEQAGSTVTATFMTMYGGIPLLREPAVVVLENGEVRGVTLRLCRVSSDSESSRPLSLEHTALLHGGGDRFGLCYQDGGDGTASAEWAVAE